MFPVAMYGRLKSSVRRSAWVPLPAPGGPTRMRLSSLDIRRSETTAPGTATARAVGLRTTLFEEALVVAHHQLRLELLHRVQGDADDDEDRRAAEEEVGARLVDEDRRHGGDRGQIQRAGERQAREDAI